MFIDLRSTDVPTIEAEKSASIVLLLGLCTEETCMEVAPSLKISLDMESETVRNRDIAKKLRDVAALIGEESTDPIVLGTALMQMQEDLGHYTEWFFGLDILPGKSQKD
jgi:hypothetical protein